MSDRPVPVLVLHTPDAASAARALAERVLVDRWQLAGSDAAPVLTDALREGLDDPGVGGVILCAGADLIGDPAAVQALAGLGGLDLPGFAQIFRAMAFDSCGPQAMLSHVAARRVESTAFFVLPGDPQAVLLAWEQLIAPNLAHVGAQVLSADAPATMAPAPPPSPEAPPEASAPLGNGVQVSQLAAPAPDAPDDAIAPWRSGLDALGGTLDREAWAHVPSGFDRVAGARDVLLTAGERGLVTLANGTRYVAFGYPDLLRPASKVLLVREAFPIAEVIALHRFPRKVGIVCDDEEDGYLPRADWDPDPIARQLTGRPPDNSGTLFAVDARAVYIRRENGVIRWDGSREHDEGTASQAMASLMLRWSSR